MKQFLSLEVPVTLFVSQLEIIEKIFNVPSPSEVLQRTYYFCASKYEDYTIHKSAL